MTRISGAIATMVLARQLVLVVSGIGMVVLARLVTPVEFGIFATVLATFVLLELAIRFGLPEYLISAPRVSTGMVRSLLGLSLAIGMVVIALALAFLLTPLSRWLSPDMRLALLAMVPGLLAVPFIAVPEAVLRRRLEFGTIAWLGVATVTADVAVSIALALMGAGPLALVGGLVASRLGNAAILLATSRRLLGARFSGWRRFLRTAPHQTATSLLPKASDLAIVLIVPSALGLGALGLYNRAQSVVALLDKVLLDGVSPVVLPAISEQLRSGVPVAEVYGAKTARLSVLIWPVFAVIALLAEPVVVLLLGDQWIAAVPVVRILCGVGLVAPFTSMSMQFFAATGRIPEYLRIQAVNQIVRLACMGTGALHSLEAVAAGLVLAMFVKAVRVRHHIEAIIGPLGRRGRRLDYPRAGVITAMSLAGPALLLVVLAHASSIILCLGGIALAALGWLGGVILTGHPLLGDLRGVPLLRRNGLAGSPRASS